MRKISNKTGFAATLLGAVLLLELAAMRVIFTADNNFAYFVGHRIQVVCAARQHFGVPCPTCGLTRGIVLSLHGHIGEAWRLSPAGPLAVLGMLGMGFTLLAFGRLERRRTSDDLSRIKCWIERSALAYGALATVIWISSWVSVITRLLVKT